MPSKELENLTFQMIYDKAKRSFEPKEKIYFDAIKKFFPAEQHDRLLDVVRSMYYAGYATSFGENIGTDVIPSSD